jgi:hypothetical protein
MTRSARRLLLLPKDHTVVVAMDIPFKTVPV